MTTPSATFAIDLEDNTSATALRAAGSLEGLQDRIHSGTRELREMQAAMRRLRQGTVINVAAFRELRDRIAAQKASVASAQAAYIQLGGTFERTEKRSLSTGVGLEQLLGTAQGMPGPIGSLSSRVTALGGRFAGLAGPIGIAVAAVAALTAALTALTAATVAATAALVKYGIAQAGARREELLRLEGLNLLPRVYGFARASAEGMQSAIDRASDSSALGRDELGRYASQLGRLGLQGEALSRGLEAVGIAATAAGDRGAAFARRMVLATARAGGSVADMAERLEAHFGPIASRVMLDWNVQLRTLRGNLARIFSGLRIESFLQKVKEITDLFSQTTVTGRALKSVVESMFQPLIDTIASVGPVVVGFVQGIVIELQKVTIAVLNVRLWLLKTFGVGGDVSTGLDKIRIGTLLARAAFAGMIGVVGALAGVTAALAASVLIVTAPLLLMGVAAFGIGAALAFVVAKVIEFSKWLAKIDWSELASRLIDGLVKGIKGGVGRVVGAIRGLASSAANAFTSAIDSHSPSRLFEGFGETIPAGVTVGIETGTPKAQRAVEDMVALPEIGGGGLGVGGGGVTIEQLVVHAPDGAPESFAEAVRAALADALEGLAIARGGRVPA